ncbi:MAG: 1,4-alpha-glucan branching enzyme, partial [Gemmatimonadota bacterium]|nr:1,4-alpha-glucan branching enzyme [Gemmatimonadota bacterium]
MSPNEDRPADALAPVLGGVCPDPRGVLGPIADSGDAAPRLRVFMPPARRVDVRPSSGTRYTRLERVDREGVFEGPAPSEPDAAYVLRVTWDSGETGEIDDPYRFRPRLTDDDLADFRAGSESRLDRLLGARVERREGIEGTRFSVWAPHALAVNVMGSF